MPQAVYSKNVEKDNKILAKAMERLIESQIKDYKLSVPQIRKLFVGAPHLAPCFIVDNNEMNAKDFSKYLKENEPPVLKLDRENFKYSCFLCQYFTNRKDKFLRHRKTKMCQKRQALQNKRRELEELRMKADKKRKEEEKKFRDEERAKKQDIQDKINNCIDEEERIDKEEFENMYINKNNNTNIDGEKEEKEIKTVQEVIEVEQEENK